MEENNVVMMENNENEDLVVMENEQESVDSVSSGNSFNKGVAVAAAAGIIGAAFVIKKVIKNVKAKKAAKANEQPVEGESKPKEKKGIKLGKHKTIVVIDNRSESQQSETKEENKE